MKKIMNHAEYMKRVKKLTEAQLRFIIKDCHEAMAQCQTVKTWDIIKTKFIMPLWN